VVGKLKQIVKSGLFWALVALAAVAIVGYLKLPPNSLKGVADWLGRAGIGRIAALLALSLGVGEQRGRKLA
jgi:hypothetical protein